VNRHRFDPFSFIAGAVALGVALAVLVGQVTVSVVDLRLAGPVLVLALGVALLLAGGRDRTEDGVATAGAVTGATADGGTDGEGTDGESEPAG
jgi:hypothetical protein